MGGAQQPKAYKSCKIQSYSVKDRSHDMDSWGYFPMFLVLLCTVAIHSQNAINTTQIQICCNEVSEWSVCYSACMQFASNCPPQVENKTQYLTKFCPQIPSTLESCFNNASSSTPPTPSPQLLECCSKSSNADCTEVCVEQLTLGVLDDASIQAVIAVCGPPLTLHSDPIWSCLLLYAELSQHMNLNSNSTNNCTVVPPSTSPIPPTPLPVTIKYADWPRLQCCLHSNDSICSKACLYEYSGSRTINSWETLNLNCIHRPTEGNLTRCLNDVNTSCTLGCSGLTFCKNLNNRPLTMFRQCKALSDTAAKLDYTTWKNRQIIYHPLITIYTLNLETCYPDWWKAAACVFQIQPCQPNTHTSLLCKDDCLFMMRACSTTPNKTPEEICEILSPSHLQEDCISLGNYLNESTYTPDDLTDITTPCTSNPCVDGKCIINHGCTDSKDQTCVPYLCVPECELGNSPKLVLGELDVVNVATLPNIGKECYGYVNRTSGTRVFGQQTKDLRHEYCINLSSCSYKGTNYTHGEVFSDSCNLCTCQSGHVTCTRHVCPRTTEDLCSVLSCNCPALYNPVCTNNGRTLPNVFFAKCLGYTANQQTSGSCTKDTDPCDPSPCPSNAKCIPYRHVCISESNTTIQHCPQYRCETAKTCSKNRNTLICDQSGQQHNLLCNFINTEEKVDYYGYCQDECSQEERFSVCAINGETYVSKCHAEGAGMAVDYIRDCRDVPAGQYGCEQIKCPGLPYVSSYEQCVGPTPPGACCRQCGAMVRVIISQQQLSRNRQAMGVASIDSTEIVTRLRLHIAILQCKLVGYQAFDGTFIFLLLPSNTSSYLNIQACNVEATRLSVLINTGSPLVVSDPYLSFFVAADHTHARKLLAVDNITSAPILPSGRGEVNSSSFYSMLLILYVFILLL